LLALHWVLFFETLKRSSVAIAILTVYTAPVFLAWAILGQALGWQVAVGGAAVLAAGALVVLYEGPEPASPEAPAGVTMPR